MSQVNLNVIRILNDKKKKNNKSNEINLYIKNKSNSILNSISSTIQDEIESNLSPIISDYSSISKEKILNKISSIKQLKNEMINNDFSKIFNLKSNKSYSMKSIFKKKSPLFKIRNGLNYNNLMLKKDKNNNQEDLLDLMKIRNIYYKKYDNEIKKLDKILSNYNNIFDEIKEEKYQKLQKKRKNGIENIRKIFFNIDLVENENLIEHNLLKQIFKYSDEIFSSSNQIQEILLNEIKIIKNSLIKNQINNYKSEIKENFPEIKKKEIKNKKLKENYLEKENKLKLVIYNYEDEIEHLTNLLNKNKEYFNKYNDSIDIISKKNLEMKIMKIKEKDIYIKNKSKINNYKEKLNELENQIIKLSKENNDNLNKKLKEQSVLINENNILKLNQNKMKEILLMKEEELNSYRLKYFNEKEKVEKQNLLLKFFQNNK